MAVLRMRFINGDDLIAKGIDWVTSSLWAHVELVTDTGYLGAHAGSGIQIRPFDYCKPTRERHYAIPCTDEQLAACMAFATEHIGCKYDYSDILGLFLHDRSLHSTTREICSMFVYESAWQGGIMMLNALPTYSHLITPETLHLSPLLIGNRVNP